MLLRRALPALYRCRTPATRARRCSASAGKLPVPSIFIIHKKIDEARRPEFTKWQTNGQALLDEVLGEESARMHHFQKDLGEGRELDTVVVTFRSRELHDTWRSSTVLKVWLDQGDDFQTRSSTVTVDLDDGSLQGWLPPASGQGPPKWKVGLTVLTAIYPTLQLMKGVVMPKVHAAVPALSTLPIVLQDFCAATLTVSCMVLVSLPATQKALHFFNKPSPPLLTALNTAGVLGVSAGVACLSGVLVTGDFSSIY